MVQSTNDPQKTLHPSTKCAIFLVDRRFVAVLESCAEVKNKVEGTHNKIGNHAVMLVMALVVAFIAALLFPGISSAQINQMMLLLATKPSPPPPPVLNIQSVALSNTTFTANVANGTVGTVSVAMSDASAFTGSLALTGANTGGFQLSGNTLQQKATTGTPAGTYNDVTIVASQATAVNSPQQISPTLTGSSSGAIVSVVTLTNGPPNIPNASPCTTVSCAWIAAGWPSGTHVSLVYADMAPISADYGGTFSIADQSGHAGDASHFSIATSSVGYTDPFNNPKTRNVGEIKTSGTVAAGDYFIAVNAGGSSQNVTVHAVNGTNVACGASIPTSGTVLLSPSCTYILNTPGGTALSASSNTTYIGAGNGGTILDGNATTCNIMQANSTSSVSVIGVQFQNYGAGGTSCGSVSLGFNGADGSVVRNSRFLNGDVNARGIDIHGGGSFIANNVVNHQGYAGLSGPNLPAPSSSALITVIGNEISDTNYAKNDVCNDANSYKITGSGSIPVTLNNNYFHDNLSNGPWADFYPATVVISGNTFVRDSAGGFQWEQSRTGTTVDHNVFIHEGDGSTPGAFFCYTGANNTNPIYPSGYAPGVSGMFINGSANMDIHDNNVSAYTVAGVDGVAFHFTDESFNGTGFVGSNTVHNNTVNFFTQSSGSTWGWDSSSEDTSGSLSNTNHFHLVGGNTSTDTHWYWLTQGNTVQTFANYRNSGQDANSTIDTTDTSTTGCTHVACSGSGIGAEGVPH